MDKTAVSSKVHLKVHDIMSRPVIMSYENESLKAVAEKMQRYKIGSIVIMDKSKKAVGIITEGDIVRRFAARRIRGSLYTLRAKNVMSRPLVYIGIDEDVKEAANTMVEYGIKKLCVIDEKEKLVGMITDNDIMKNSSYLIDVLSEIVNARGPILGEEESIPEEFVTAMEESELEGESIASFTGM